MRRSESPLDRHIIAKSCQGAQASEEVDSALQHLVDQEAIFSWSNDRVWFKDEFTCLYHKGRELIQDTPRWKSNLIQHLKQSAPESCSAVYEKVFRKLKDDASVRVWPRHGPLKGDALCLRPIRLDFYLGPTKEQFLEISGKLERSKVSFDDSVRFVCGRSAQREKQMPDSADASPSSSQNPDGEQQFQRDLTEQLVFAWQDAESPDARESLERVMFNVGLDRLGEPGEATTFNGIEHDTDHPLFPGDQAVVVEPGWMLERGPRKRVLAKAKVTGSNT